MNCEQTATATASSNAFGRARDAQVCTLLDTHPVTATMLVGPGWFPTRNKSLARLRRLVARKKVRLVGTVCRKAGRPEHVYCRWRPKPDQLLHEVLLTELCFRLDAGRVLRGPHAPNPRYRPDAELSIKGSTYYLELDRGTMSYAQVTGRFRRYEGCEQFVLWVCSSVERLEGMRRRAEGVRATALFTTYDEALASPHSTVWRDYRGDRVALPREGLNPGL